MNQNSILFALPCYGGVMSAKTALGLIETGKVLQEHRISHDFLFVSNQSLIPKGRSEMANYFMNATNFTHLMWIDADIGFRSEDIFNLLRTDVPHVMATYRHKVQYEKYSVVLDTDHSGNIQWNAAKNAVKVQRNVGGFSLIHRSVFEAIRDAGLAKRFVPGSDGRTVSQVEIDNSYHYYDIEICEKTGQILPEDFAFHDKCRKAGIDNWLRPDIVLTHNGNTDFIGSDITEILRNSK